MTRSASGSTLDFVVAPLNLRRPGHKLPGPVVDSDEPAVEGEQRDVAALPALRPHRVPATPPCPASSRIAAILAHLSAPIAALLSAGSLSLLGPLLVWLVMKHDPYARRAAAGAFNFNLTFWLLYLISWLLIFTVIGAVSASR